jgi:isoleucyl-tRNA synthetase
VETAPREAYAIAAEQGCQVGVRKELTPELRAEGMVREAVHMINNLRRESGFAIADRITLYADAGEQVAQALQAHEALLAAEVLASGVHYTAAPPDAPTHAATIAGHPVTFAAVRNQR